MHWRRLANFVISIQAYTPLVETRQIKMFFDCDSVWNWKYAESELLIVINSSNFGKLQHLYYQWFKDLKIGEKKGKNTTSRNNNFY